VTARFPTRRRVIRPSLWSWRIVIPAFAVAIISMITRNGFHALPVAIVILASALILLSVERAGLFITDQGLIGRQAFFGRTVGYRWADVTGFSVERIPGYARIVVCVSLRTGRKEILPTLQVWSFQRKIVEPLCGELNEQLDAARHRVRPA
jgi:hypothetical protein